MSISYDDNHYTTSTIFMEKGKNSSLSAILLISIITGGNHAPNHHHTFDFLCIYSKDVIAFWVI